MAESYDKVIEGPGGVPLVGLFGLNTNKNTSLRGTLGVSGAVTLDSTLNISGAVDLTSTLHVAGAATFGAGITATGPITASGTGTFASPLVVGTAQVIVGALNQVAGPTGVSAPTGSIFMSYSGGTGPATRAFINSNGATGWIAITTAS